MAIVISYRDLDVWRRSLDLAELIYRVTVTFPAQERFGLTSQMRRAAVSVAANIAEGAEREGKNEFLHFLSIASGSLAETETFVILAHRLDMISEEQSVKINDETANIGRMISGLKRTLRLKS